MYTCVYPYLCWSHD